MGLKYISSTCFKSGHNHLQEDFIAFILKLLICLFHQTWDWWIKSKLQSNLDRRSANKVTLVKGLLKKSELTQLFSRIQFFRWKLFKGRRTLCLSQLSPCHHHHIDRVAEERWWKNLTTWKKIELFFSHDINLDDVNEVDDSGHVISKRHISPG